MSTEHNLLYIDIDSPLPRPRMTYREGTALRGHSTELLTAYPGWPYEILHGMDNDEVRIHVNCVFYCPKSTGAITLRSQASGGYNVACASACASPQGNQSSIAPAANLRVAMYILACARRRPQHAAAGRGASRLDDISRGESTSVLGGW